MQITRLRLSNWRNFTSVDVPLGLRAFLIGPNASGKSNLLDALRFLQEIADPEGGLQRAAGSRGGVSKLRCLAARRYSDVEIRATLLDDEALFGSEWEYALTFTQDSQHRPLVRAEQVLQAGKELLVRPNPEDEADPERLTQTALEQITANASFRRVAELLATIAYYHAVPQIIREPDRYRSPEGERDRYGKRLLEHLATTTRTTRDARLRRINKALKAAIPQIDELKLQRDERGVPHLQGRYTHWRPQGALQQEDQFSDGTLRLLGLLWFLQEGRGPLLLEEPELSLHPALVRRLPGLFWTVQREQKRPPRQLIVSTHSEELLSDRGIGGEEVLVLSPDEEGTAVNVASDLPGVRASLVEAGLSVGEALMSRTEPEGLRQLTLAL